jgi:serine/threonine protein kinase
VSATHDEAVLDELLSAWQQEAARGNEVPAAALCRDRPDLAGELARRIAGLRRLEGLARATSRATVSAAAADSDPGPTAPGAAPQPPRPTLPGYQVLGKLGEGGMGVVYRARDLALSRVVAIKQLSHPAPSAEALGRFRAEAEALAKLRHPHVVQVYAAGEQDGRPYFVMEYIEGGGLERAIADRPQPPADAARLVMLLARAVQAAHRVGIVHRDLKPANVLLAPPADEPALNTAYGLPKVSDFGLAKTLGEGQGRTADGAVLGTPCYMAPEQTSGVPEEVGPAADVYALGGILYALLTGQVPFHGKTVWETLEMVRTRPPAPPSELRPDVPPPLEAVCLRCLAKEPSDRPLSAQALADELARFLAGEPMPHPTGGSGASNVSPGGKGERKTALASGPSRPRMRRLLAAVGAAAVLAAVLLAVWLMTRSPSAVTTPTGKDGPGTMAEAAPLGGELLVRVWTPGADRSKRGLRIGSDFGAVPVHEDEELQLEARLDRPAYAYLLWVDGKGRVTPLYPWNDNDRGKIVHDSLSVPPPDREPQALVRSPRRASQGWAVDEIVGLDTMLLLARPTPLPADVSLEKLMAGLLPAPLGQHDEVVVRGFERGRLLPELSLGEYRRPKPQADAINDQMLRLLDRLQDHFEVIRYVQFAHVPKP